MSNRLRQWEDKEEASASSNISALELGLETGSGLKSNGRKCWMNVKPDLENLDIWAGNDHHLYERFAACQNPLSESLVVFVPEWCHE
jgi:hypothetical protein